MIYVMNDYELIYLIKCNACDHALNFMYQKYQRFIWKHIHYLNLEQKEHDDFHQEGLLTLHKAIQTFDESYRKSFTKYFELILRRHFYGLMRYLPDYTLFETTDFVKEFTLFEEDVEYMSFESSLEKDIHDNYFINRKSIKAIATETGLTPKQIYNAIYRIKEKYKIMI